MNYLDFKENPKEGYGWIYKYTSPSGKSYIGQTTYSIYHRAGADGKRYKNCVVFYNAIQKYGLENFTIEILDEVPEEELDKIEGMFIKKYNTIRPNGYNYYSFGSGLRDTKKSTAIEVYDLELNYIESFSSLINAAKKYNIPYQAISQCINKKISHYKDMVFVREGEKPTKPKVIKTHGRKTGQYTLDGELIAVFESANSAAKAIGKKSSDGRNIRLVCSGKRNSAYGYSWKYLD